MGEPYSTMIWIGRVQALQSQLRIIENDCEGSENPHVQRIGKQAKAGIAEADKFVDDPEWETDAYNRIGERVDCWPCSGTGLEYGETCVTCGGYGWINE